MNINHFIYNKMHHFIVKNFKVGDKVKPIKKTPAYVDTYSSFFNDAKKLRDAFYIIKDIQINRGFIRLDNNDWYCADFFEKVKNEIK